MWRNWTGDQVCDPQAIEHPADVDGLRALVERTAATGGKLRAVGAGHSFTDIACTAGTMVRLDRMDRILDVDRSSGLVEVEAGISLHNLNNQLWDQHGLAIPNLGDIDVQAIAGALSTSTHGTGSRAKTIADAVQAVEVVLPDGTQRRFDARTDPEAMRAYRVALGSLGVITSLTLRCRPAYTLRRHDHALPLTDVLTGFDQFADANEHFEFYVFPHADVALCRETQIVDEPPQPWGGARSWWEEVAMENHAMELVSRACRRFPSRIPGINRQVSKLLGGTVKIDRSYRVYATVRNVRFTEMEYAVPREHGPEALRRVLEMIPRHGHAVGFPIEVRVLDADDAMLSTAHHRQVMYIAVHMFEGMLWEPYFRDVEAIMNDYDGRPHWGKRHFQTAAMLAPRYPDWDSFQRLRAQLDPTAMLSNEYTDRVLGPVGATAPVA